MNKRFAAALAATAVLGVTTAFAANPFSDVEAGHWAYQSVSQLASAGIINGYPDGTFKGQNNITRYEMAQMVAKAMANQGRADAEQNAMINRLADEFSEELNNLGVRVGNLEKRVGNVKVTGDARVRYTGYENEGRDTAADKWDFRARLQFNAMVNEDTTATVRVTTGNIEFGKDKSDVTVDRAFVTHKFGDKATVEVGRTGLFVGQGLIYDDKFDGVKATFGKNVKLTAGYGELGASDLAKGETADDAVTVLQLDGKVSNVDLTGFYLKGHDGMETAAGDKVDVYGFAAGTKFGKVGVAGEWLEQKDVEDSQAWTASLSYGDYNMAKKGTWMVGAQYLDIDVNAPILSTTYEYAPVDYTGWVASAKYAVGKNVGLAAYVAFAGETQDGKEDYADFYRAVLNYKF